MTVTAAGSLVTKLHISRLRSLLVRRLRLIEVLRAGLECKVTLPSAPAGFGKTTLLAQWTPQSPRCVTCLAPEDSDNDPSRFWTCFIAALQPLQPDIRSYAYLFCNLTAGPYAARDN